jgi:hypothetical protein
MDLSLPTVVQGVKLHRAMSCARSMRRHALA